MNAITICMEVGRGRRMPKQGPESTWISSSARAKKRQGNRAGARVAAGRRQARQAAASRFANAPRNGTSQMGLTFGLLSENSCGSSG